MASTSIPTLRWANHVFLSFRGEDTRKSFTDHLFSSLERSGIKTFKDDHGLERGGVISIELMKAIEESMFAIIVLSPNYASSTWCLDELQKIVECKKTFGQRGSFAETFRNHEEKFGDNRTKVDTIAGYFAKAFRKHEENIRDNRTKVDTWKNALREIAGYSGWVSEGWNEAALVETFVDHIQKKLIPKLPSSTNGLVGIDSRIKEVYSLLGMGLNDVRFIGIWGMEGIGKTTTARLVYEAIKEDFKGTDEIQGIVLDFIQSFQSYEAHWNNEAFSKTSQLRLLKLGGMKLPLGLKFLLSSLKVLHWRGCPLKTLPLTNQLDEIVDLKLRMSDIEQLWHGTQFLGKLRSIDLGFSASLKQSPDVTAVPNLESLVLEWCIRLTEVHHSLLHHKKLVLLNLKRCESLKALPCKMEMSSLKELNLSGCSKLKYLPEFGECMEHLSKLSLERTALTKLPPSLGCLVGLAFLNLKNCINLVCLPDTISKLKSLKVLDVSGCLQFTGLSEGLKEMKFFEELDLVYKFDMIEDYMAQRKSKRVKPLLVASNCASLETSKFNPTRPYCLFALLLALLLFFGWDHCWLPTQCPNADNEGLILALAKLALLLLALWFLPNMLIP